ncbi:MAG: AarF/ABC1/UbiB kinase family protein [Candidatus Dadabacteria bacterium]|nr:MAG: AarF/ABC1/UbiB kinase family protein [Candidatus Dadabacteria bacterium]
MSGPADSAVRGIRISAQNGTARARARAIWEEGEGAARIVAGLEILLSSIEQAVWDLREAVEEAWGAVRAEGLRAREDLAELDRQTRDLAAELTRLLSASRTVATIVGSYRWLSIRGAFMSRRAYARAVERTHRRNGKRFVKMANRLQGGIIKIGQILSARSDILPEAFVAPMRELQDRVAPFPFEDVLDVLRQEWGEERLSQVVLSAEPVAAASIAQVHIARLADGRMAAIKVQRPGIATLLKHDVAILRRIVDSLKVYLPESDIDTVVDEIAEQLLAETDFDRERVMLERAATALAGEPTVSVPEVYGEWCTGRLLVTEFIDGARLDAALADAAEAERNRILRDFATIYLKQILEWGFFQPDTHPGNFLVDREGRLVLLDFGCVRELDAAFRRDLARVLEGFIRGDDQAAAQALGDLGFATRSGDLTGLIQMVRQALGGLIAGGSSAWDAEAVKASIGPAMEQLAEDPVTAIPRAFVMVGRALSTMGGVFFEHRPDLNPFEVALPVLTRVLAGSAE